jgi:hypothetical protein
MSRAVLVLAVCLCSALPVLANSTFTNPTFHEQFSTTADIYCCGVTDQSEPLTCRARKGGVTLQSTGASIIDEGGTWEAELEAPPWADPGENPYQLDLELVKGTSTLASTQVWITNVP